MKKTITTLITAAVLLTLTTGAFAQRVNTQQLDQLKVQGLISGNVQLQNPEEFRTPLTVRSNGGGGATINSCDCWVERDRAWQVVPFDGSGGSGGPGLPPEYRNDDWSTDTISLVSPFCFYGQYLRKMFINNNGNVSFGQPYSTFTSDSFPNANFVMVAPFWADVDTRDSLSGLVYYEQTNSHIIVQWDSVGYFNTASDKRNSFQLILTDGLDPLLPTGYNVSFCYKDMQWTTGDASGGSLGFGGTPATVGVNQGNGTNFIQLGRFDAPGNAYDGPYGAADGVDFLDNQSFIFNTCVSNFNIPPIVSSLSACDTIVLCDGDTTTISVDFLAPEQGQLTTPTVNYGTMQGVTVTNLSSGPIANAELEVIAGSNNVGFHTIQFTGTDNGTPTPQSTTSRVVVRVITAPTASFFVIPDTGMTVYFDNATVGTTRAFWDFGDGTSGYSQFDTSHYYASPGVYDVMMVAFSDGGCFTDTLYQTVTILPVGIGQVTVMPFIQVIPNPSNGLIRLSGKTNDLMNLQLTDAAGRLVFRKEGVMVDTEMDLGDIQSGLYFYSITDRSGQAVRSGRLVIE